MTTWVGLEGIILSKKKWDRERHIPYDLTYTWNLKTKTKINKQKPKLIDSENRLMVTRGRELVFILFINLEIIWKERLDKGLGWKGLRGLIGEKEVDNHISLNIF